MNLKREPLKLFGKSLSVLLILCLPIYQSYSQCTVDSTIIDIIQCDMENVDFDNNGSPDGIINIYTETGTTVADGIWTIDPKFEITLDTSTGNLSMWALQNSTVSTTIDEYLFELRSATCGDVVLKTARLILGPYSGVALPRSGTLNVNAQGCDRITFDLFTAFLQDDEIPSPHLNGIWTYNGSSPNLISFKEDSSMIMVEIPYQAGLPLVDQEVFEFTYRVPSVTPCSLFQETTVRVVIIRQVDSGLPIPTDICEDDVLAGLFDADINLRDDQYLEGEDIEGEWIPALDITGQITDEQDSMVNLKDVYNFLIDGGNNLRYGCQTFNFNYTVDQRSAVCENDTTAVSFTFYEQLRPFNQPDPPPQICANTSPGRIDLFDLLEFTTEGNFDFIYKQDNYVNWRLVSGSSNLGLRQQKDRLETPYPIYTGRVSTFGAEPGTYVFEYGVSPKINCQEPGDLCDPFLPEGHPDHCVHPCDELFGRVTIEVLPFDYAGEDTVDINLCESITQVDLRSLLISLGGNTIAEGVWTDTSGNEIDNTFVFPAIQGSQTFRFTHRTEHPTSGCVDQAILSFTVFEEPEAGEDQAAIVCSNDLTLTLYDVLGDNTIPTTGIWIGPFGYESEDHLGVFDPMDDMLPILGPGDYTYTVPGNLGCLDTDQAVVTVSIVEPLTIGTDRAETFCKIDGRVNLFSLLDRDTPRTGFFEDTDNTEVLSPEGVLEFETLTNEIYNFRYVVSNADPCDESSLNVAVQIVDLPEPNVPNQEFCILDIAKLDDIEVDVLNFNWYATLESETPIIDNPILLDNQTLYIASVDADNCESERVAVVINIFNAGEQLSSGEQCIIVPNQEFCILDATRVEDIEVDLPGFNWYATLESETPIMDNPVLLDNQTLYIASADSDGCESERVAITIDILNTGERSSTGELCTLDFQDGITPNGDNQNDTFDLFIEGVYNIPDAFPDFDLKIFNRYGSQVYIGNINTEEFRGESNTSVRLGDDLPTGTYYYIFTPNLENNLPIQGSFYLSR